MTTTENESLATMNNPTLSDLYSKNTRNTYNRPPAMCTRNKTSIKTVNGNQLPIGYSGINKTYIKIIKTMNPQILK